MKLRLTDEEAQAIRMLSARMQREWAIYQRYLRRAAHHAARAASDISSSTEMVFKSLGEFRAYDDEAGILDRAKTVMDGKKKSP